MPRRLKDVRAQLALIALAALVVRVWAVLAWTRQLDPQGDQNFYWRQGQYLARGLGFVYRNNYGEYVPTAVHPPLYSAYLGLVSVLGGTSHAWHRLASTLLGAAAVFVIGLAARRVAGDRAAVVAAVVAAVWPNLWVNDAMMLSESMYALTIGLVILAAYVFKDRPTTLSAVGLGGAVALAGLTRAEATGLFVLLVLPLVALTRVLSRRDRALRFGAAVLAGLVVIGPWIVRNAVTFERHPVTVSNGSGFVLEISNCDQTYGLAPPTDATGAPLAGQGPDTLFGYWAVACDRTPWPAGDETVVEAAKRQTALDYIGDHGKRFPLVVAARIGRIWDVWRPLQSFQFNTFWERRGGLPTLAGMAMYYPLLVLGGVGLVALWRRRVTIIPFVAIAVMTSLTAAVSFGITRYRVGADVALCVLAGVAVDAILRFDRSRRAARAEAVVAAAATPATTATAAPATTEPTVAAAATTAGGGGARAWLRTHWFGAGVAVTALVALVIRALNVLSWRPTCQEDIVAVITERGTAGFTPSGGGTACFGIWGDSAYYYLQARLTAQGHWFVDSYGWFASGGTAYRPSAGDPPLYTLFLAALARVGLTSGTAMRLATGVVGVVGVVLIALLVRRLAGPRAGLVAGVLAAVSPMLWINDAMLLSEGPYVPLIVLALLAAYAFWDEPTVLRAALFGGALGLAALTRGEAVLLFGAMVLPLLWGLCSLGLKRLAGLALVIWVVGGLLLAPWILYNRTRFAEPVLMTATTGAVLSSASCDSAYQGEYIGYYANCFDEYVQAGLLVGRIPGCDDAAVAAARIDPKSAEAARCWPNDPSLDESQRDKLSRDLAIEYMKSHKRQLPKVMLARIGRAWDLYNPQLGEPDEPLGQNVRLNWQVEGRGKTSSEAATLLYWALLPVAVVGAVVLWRRRIPLSPLLSMAVVITVTSAFTFGVTRYRVPVDVAEIVLAGVAAGALLERWWPTGETGTIQRLRPARRGAAEPTPADAPSPVDPDAVPEDVHA